MSEILTQTPIQKIERDITWIRGHVLVALLAVAVIAGSIIGGITLIEGLIQRHDEAAAVRQQVKEGVDVAAQAALLAQLKQEHDDSMVRDTATQARIDSLVALLTQQRAETQKQISKDATLSAKDAADRLITQTHSTPSDVTTSNDSVTMTLPLTRRVVQDLDMGAQAHRDVTNLEGQLDAQKILTNDSKVELTTANQVIQADKTTLIATIQADNKACDVRVDKQAEKDRKRGFWVSLASIAFGYALHR